MENSLKDTIIIGVSVVVLSTFVAVLSWTFVIGFSIYSSFENKIMNSYNDFGVSTMIDSSNVNSVDSVNVYKMIEENRNAIKDYSITNLDGSHVLDTKELLNRPADKFSVNVIGDYAVGYQIEISEVPNERVDP